MRRWVQRVILPAVVLTVITHCNRVQGQYDLTGEWRISYLDGIDRVEWDSTIVQEGDSLTVGQWRGSIDPKTGRFSIDTYQHPRCEGPWGIHAELIDPNHFTGYFGGFIFLELPPCRLVASVTVNGERLDPLDLCAGDCDGSGRATVDEVVRLVRCSLAPILAIGEPCRTTCAADVDANGVIGVNELVSVVNNLLQGCQ